MFRNFHILRKIDDIIRDNCSTQYPRLNSYLFGCIDYEKGEIYIQRYNENDRFSPSRGYYFSQIDLETIQGKNQIEKLFELMGLFDFLSANIYDNYDSIYRIILQLCRISPSIAFDRWDMVLGSITNVPKSTQVNGLMEILPKLTVRLLRDLLRDSRSTEVERLFLSNGFSTVVSNCYKYAHHNIGTFSALLDSLIKQGKLSEANGIWTELTRSTPWSSGLKMADRSKLLASLLMQLTKEKMRYQIYTPTLIGISNDALSMVKSWIDTISDPTEHAKLMVRYCELK